jgi:hypothetical protein
MGFDFQSGRVVEVSDPERIKFMGYVPQSGLGNMLSGLAGNGLGDWNSYANAASQQAQYQPYTYTVEQLAERQKLREEEEARVAEEQKAKDDLRALNRPKMMKCFGGSIICLAFAVLFFSMNMSFHNTDYNTSLISSAMWSMDVVTVGAAIGLGLLGRYYSK